MSLIKDLKKENKELKRRLLSYEDTESTLYQNYRDRTDELFELKKSTDAQIAYERKTKDYYIRMLDLSDNLIDVIKEQYEDFRQAQDIVDCITGMIEKIDGVNEEDIRFMSDENRFWITVLNRNFSGDLENDDSELKQYHIVKTTNDNIDSADRLKIVNKTKGADEF